MREHLFQQLFTRVNTSLGQLFTQWLALSA